MKETFFEQKDHHQGLARTHKLSDGTIYFFLTHSETDDEDQGSISQYRYAGPTQGDHILDRHPSVVAPMVGELMFIDEHHPSDVTFLPDVDGLDAGYLFVAEEYDQRRVTIYRWAPHHALTVQGHIASASARAPQFVFIDRVGNDFFLGIASTHEGGWAELFSARDRDLFPKCVAGSMDVAAFKPVIAKNPYPFPITGSPCQIKFVRDALNKWYLLGFRSDPDGTDFVDVYGVRFNPFHISGRLLSIHVFFRPGDTGFASTGSHYIEASGRMLISSSYRWSEDEGPAESSYVSRVDECPSW